MVYDGLFTLRTMTHRKPSQTLDIRVYMMIIIVPSPSYGFHLYWRLAVSTNAPLLGKTSLYIMYVLQIHTPSPMISCARASLVCTKLHKDTNRPRFLGQFESKLAFRCDAARRCHSHIATAQSRRVARDNPFYQCTTGWGECANKGE